MSRVYYEVMINIAGPATRVEVVERSEATESRNLDTSEIVELEVRGTSSCPGVS